MSNAQLIGVLVVILLMAPSIVDWVRNFTNNWVSRKDKEIS